MKVRNYYKLSKEELDKSIEKIRHWLWDNPKSERYETAIFALDIALCAKKLKRNDSVQDVIDFAC